MEARLIHRIYAFTLRLKLAMLFSFLSSAGKELNLDTPQLNMVFFVTLFLEKIERKQLENFVV